MKKLISLLLAAVMVLGCFSFVFADEDILIAPAPTAAPSEITILYTNDVHTYIANEGGLTYADVAGLKASLAAEGKNVLLVDAGDHLQGTAYGGMDKGATIVKLMNAAKYDVATLGNHEFDFGMEGALAAVEAADYPYVSCNFYHEENGVAGDPVLEPYKVFDFNGTKVAFVGVTTPESFTKSTPKYFQDAEGNYIYGIAGGNDGAELYAAVQKAIDAASAEADYVIALAHLGVDESSSPWTSREVIANTTGLDAWIDGHSHTVIDSEKVADKEGKEVVLSQTGLYLANIGKMVIAADGTITSELLTSAEVEADADVQAIADEWVASVDKQLETVIAETEIDFTINGADGKRAVRKAETNMGDLNADAYYYYINEVAGIDCDVTIMNGGGIRASIAAGEWNFKSTKTVNTFGNVLCAMKVPGQMILDALEFGARFITPEDLAENGGFLHTGGLTYGVYSNIENTVKTDEKSVWLEGPTQYKVHDVKVYNKTTGEYEALDPKKMYTIGGTNYTLRDQGDGFNMFQEADGMELILDGISEDYLAFAGYLQAFADTDKDGIPNIATANSPLAAYPGYLMNYEEAAGGGRIVVSLAPVSVKFKDVVKGAWYETFIQDTCDDGIFVGKSADKFGVSDNISYAEMFTVASKLYKKATGDTTEFTAVEGGQWYTPFVEFAEANGFKFIESMEWTNFDGNYNAPATRRQVADLIAWALSTEYWKQAEGFNFEEAGFTDVEYGRFDTTGICTVESYGITAGYPDGSFKPNTAITRAEVATMVSNTLGVIEAGPSEEAPAVVGGWTEAADGTVTDELKAYFEKANKGLLGAKYTPVELLATQVVAGTNYKVLCDKTTVTAEPTTTPATVVLYVDLEGNCTFTSIETPAVAGGWTEAADGTVTEELKGYFEKAMETYDGAKLTPVKLLGTQVVAGTNYKVLCDVTTVTLEPTTTQKTVVLYVDLEGNCTITSVE